MKYYLGIDVGGTFVKGALVNENGDILTNGKISTDSEVGGEKIIYDIADFCKSLASSYGIELSAVRGIGMGVPGIVDGDSGVIVYVPKLKWKNFKGAELLTKLTALPVKISNDANAAALGETKFGAGRQFNNTVMITLGTGVGGGIIINGKLFEGNKGAGAELGHTVIVPGGERCSCQRRGCLEAYASATALIRDTRRAMQNNPESKLWSVGSLEKVDGKLAFDYYDTDKDAKTVVDNYIEKLALGITNFANIFRPEAIIIGGGVCAQGKNLTDPIQKIVDEELFAKDIAPRVPIIVAELGNNAGSLGAAALVMDN